MNTERDFGVPTHPQRRANLISFLLFWWTNDLFKTGNKRPLQQSDFWPLHEEDQTSLLTNQLQLQWSKDVDECNRTGKEPRLWKSAMKVLSCKDLCIISFAGLVDSVGRFLQPFFLGVFISTLMSDTPDRGLLCGCAALMLTIVLMKSIAVHHSSFKLYVIGMRMKASLKGVIFRKILLLGQHTLNEFTKGHVIDLVSNDVQRMEQAARQFFRLLVAIFDVCVAVPLLWYFIGWQALMGIIFLFLLVPFGGFLSYLSGKLRLKTAVISDWRINLMTEIVAAIREVKAHAWEWFFRDKIKETRSNEIRIIRRKSILLSCAISLMYSSGLVATFISIMTLAFSGYHLTPFVVFTLLSIINVLRNSALRSIGEGSQFVYEAYVSFDRIQEFLLLPNLHGMTDENTNVDGKSLAKKKRFENGKVNIKCHFTYLQYEVGEKLHGWTCARVEYVKEFGCTGYLFQHDKTGAELLSMVQPADENKTFSVVFRTPPENSNGIAHVLEHSVLCGSRKYPVKEPFVELMKSSLQTFLNAMTFPDRTCYPVASCNLKDFYNLIDVYMDAVFFPRAVKDPLVLAQEGWHYEIEKKDDPLTFKGVVFNEMKGLYSNPDALHGRTANQSMFPDNQYGVDSGGDPKDIPSLTFDYFKDFHSKYYHPSNAKFWFYGDDPADARLELVDQYLSQFEKIEVDSQITVQPKLTEPRRIVEDFAAGEDEDISKKIMMSINWVISEGKEDLQTSLALQFLNYLMMGTPASPLYKALVDSGLGSRVIGGGLDDGMLQATFSVGLKDLKEEDVPKVEELIMKTLEELAEKGFESDDIKAAVNTIEFQNRELNTGSFPKGLALLFAANSNWNYDKDPFEALKFEAPLEELKARLEKGEPVFQDLIKTKILDNSHKVILESRPNKQLGKKMEEEEKATLQKHRETLSEKDIEDLINETVKLKEIQETPDTPEAMKTVPGLEPSDIPKETPKVPTELVSGEPTVLRHALPTSGVIYTDVAFDLSRVPEELIPLVPLFTRALKQLGTAKGGFVSLTRRVGMSTGGISASTICMNKKGDSEPVAYLFMRGKAMAPQISELSDLMQEIALTTDFDNKDRIVQLASQARSGAQSSLVSSGHMVANASLAAQTTKAGWLSGQFSGVEQYKFLSELLKRIEDGGWEGVLQQLKALQACIFNKASCTILNITSDAEHLDPAQASLEKLASNLPVDESSGPVLLDPTLGRRADGIVVPTQVNYVGKGGNLYESGYEYHGSALVVSKLLGATYLWDKVRVVGGAYGGFCRFDPRSGDFKYLSYRDPNLGQTLETYDGAPGFLKDLELGEDELTKAVIGCMGDVDAYLLPDAKGYQAMLRHLLGEDDEYRQKVRDQILGTKVEDFHKFGEALEPVIEKGGICVVGSAESCDKAKEKYGLSLTSPFAEE